MNYTHAIQELSKNQAIFKALLSGISEKETKWRWQEDKWCLLEIICHLYDEEREDFRQRTKSVLEDPSIPLPKFDPTLWVNERGYMEQDYSQMLQKFLDERKKSIEWLNSLTKPNWSNTYQHPKMGPVSAEFFLINWAAHDFLHIRQIIKLKYFYLQDSSGLSLDYAGSW